MSSRSMFRRGTLVVIALLAALAAGCQSTGNNSTSNPGTGVPHDGY